LISASDKSFASVLNSTRTATEIFKTLEAKSQISSELSTIRGALGGLGGPGGDGGLGAVNPSQYEFAAPAINRITVQQPASVQEPRTASPAGGGGSSRGGDVHIHQWADESQMLNFIRTNPAVRHEVVKIAKENRH